MQGKLREYMNVNGQRTILINSKILKGLLQTKINITDHNILKYKLKGLN